jgi:hypothetical protein
MFSYLDFCWVKVIIPVLILWKAAPVHYLASKPTQSLSGHGQMKEMGPLIPQLPSSTAKKAVSY